VLWSGAPDCPVCHQTTQCTRTVQSLNSRTRVSAGALRYNSPDCLICRQTVRCTSGAMTNSRNGRLQKPLSQMNSKEQCTQSQSRRVRGAPDSEQEMSGVAPDCPMPQEDKARTVDFTPNPNSWVTWRRTEQPTVRVRWCTRLSGAPIDKSLPNGLFGG
jgi:hypothetical protein